MKSVLQRAMGDDFANLHPRIQAQYAITSESDHAWVGRGVMSDIWRGGAHVMPFLMLGATRRILFAERGRDVPFEVRNNAYVDSLGRETITWARAFEFPRGGRRFDEYLVYSERLGCAVVMCGTHQHLSVDLDLRADPLDGSLVVRTGKQRLRGGRGGVVFPRVLSAGAVARESFDDASGQFSIDVDVRSRRWGRVFGYRGSFELERAPMGVPDGIRPVTERREA